MYQLKNDEKFKAFQNYKGYNLKELQDQDSERYNANIRVFEDRADNIDRIKVQRKEQMVNAQIDGLKYQLAENDQKKKMLKLEEQGWAM